MTKWQLKEAIRRLVKEQYDEFEDEPLESVQDVRKRMYTGATASKKMNISPGSWMRDFALQDTDAQAAYEGNLSKYKREMEAIAEFVWSYQRKH